MTTERGYPWLKFYPILLDDPRYLKLSDGAKARYFEFYLLAGKSDAGGLVVIGNDIAMSDNLAFVLRQGQEQIEMQMKELINANLITLSPEGIVITRFAEEQGPSQAEKREEWKKRQAKKRSQHGNETDPSNIEKEKEKDEDEEVTRVSRVTKPSSSPPLGFEYPEVILAQMMHLKQIVYPTMLMREKLLNAAKRLGEEEFKKAATAILERTNNIERVINFIAKWEPQVTGNASGRQSPENPRSEPHRVTEEELRRTNII